MINFRIGSVQFKRELFSGIMIGYCAFRKYSDDFNFYITKTTILMIENNFFHLNFIFNR